MLKHPWCYDAVPRVIILVKVEKIAFELFDATSDCTLQRMDSFAQAEFWQIDFQVSLQTQNPVWPENLCLDRGTKSLFDRMPGSLHAQFLYSNLLPFSDPASPLCRQKKLNIFEGNTPHLLDHFKHHTEI